MKVTGILDKNGKKIHAGDIVEGWCNSHKLQGQVFYNGSVFKIHELYRWDDDVWRKTGDIDDLRQDLWPYYGLQLDYYGTGKVEYEVIIEGQEKRIGKVKDENIYPF